MNARQVERRALDASRHILDGFAAHHLALGHRLLDALDAEDLDEVRFIANDLIGYGEQSGDTRFHNAIGHLGSDE